MSNLKLSFDQTILQNCKDDFALLMEHHKSIKTVGCLQKFNEDLNSFLALWNLNINLNVNYDYTTETLELDSNEFKGKIILQFLTSAE